MQSQPVRFPSARHLCRFGLQKRNASCLSKFLKIENQVQRLDKRGRRKHHSKRRSKTALFKGGDPAAPSGTATLLRLHPSHEAHRGRRPPCGWTNVFW